MVLPKNFDRSLLKSEEMLPLSEWVAKGITARPGFSFPKSNLKGNLVERLEIIEKIKGLFNVEESINTTYKHFKELQERWKNAGPIPRDKYNNAWNSYHHHVEIFYDFLHLNRDLRDLDFKHNLDKKHVDSAKRSQRNNAENMISSSPNNF